MSEAITFRDFLKITNTDQSKGQKGGGMMDIVMGFIIGTFAGGIVVTFTLCLFFVNAKRRDE